MLRPAGGDHSWNTGRVNWRKVLGNIGIVVLAVVTIALTAAAFTKGQYWDTGRHAEAPAETTPVTEDAPAPAETSVPSPEAPAPSTPVQQVVVFLGDGFVQGIGGGGVDVPSVVGRLNDWQTVNLGLSGTGWTYSTTGAAAQQVCGRPSCPAVVDMVDEALTHQPTMVVMSAGFNDQGSIETAAVGAVQRVQQQAAGVRVVLVNPLYGAGAYPQYLTQRGVELAAAAAQTGASYVDVGAPLAGQTALMSDSLYPNAAGYEAIGNALGPLLANLVGTA